jgi:hypothetical protein
MIEVYVMLAVAAIGYVVGTAPLGGVQPKSLSPVARNDVKLPPRPNTINIHESHNVAQANQEERRAMASTYVRSEQPQGKTGGVVGPNHILPRSIDSRQIHSQLTGQTMDVDEFRHNNMVPFFSGSVKQSIDPYATRPILENFTGNPTYSRRKSEISPMFNPTDSKIDPRWRGVTDFLESRVEAPIARKNEVPDALKPVIVGPGFGSGFSAKPMRDDVFERDLIMPKTVDDLRTADNPKMSYHKPLPPVKGVDQRAPLPNMEKRLPETFVEWDNDRQLPTSAPAPREAMLPCPEAPVTNRIEREYTGGAGGGAIGAGPILPTDSTREIKESLQAPDVLNLTGRRPGQGMADDYGRCGAERLVVSNERDNTSSVEHRGVMSAYVKAITAPLLDLVRPTKKLYTTDAGMAGIQVQIPSKATTYDPSLWIARTTVKETLNFDSDYLNLAGPRQAVIAYDPDEITRITARQTMDAIDSSRNMKNTAYKQTVYDPDDPLRVTVKQTTHASYDGHVDGKVGDRGAYEVQEYDAKQTQKQALSQTEHFGDAYNGKTDAYRVIDVNVPRTQREHLTDNQHDGPAKGTNATRSYEDAYNATLNIDRAQVLKGRRPTDVGAKTGVGKDDINVTKIKYTCPDPLDSRGAANIQKIPPENIENIDEVSAMVRMRQGFEDNQRLDSVILDSLKTNPFNLQIGTSKKQSV